MSKTRINGEMHDYLIVGAGINGLLVARGLAKAGADVILIDKGCPGKEASWAGGGIVSPLYPWRYPPGITALANWAQDYYPQLLKELLQETGIDSEFMRCGLLMLDAEDEGIALQWAVENKHVIEQIDASVIYRQEPGLKVGFNSGLWMPDLANVRNPRLLQALRLSLESYSGLTVLADCEVTGFRKKGVGIEGVELKTGANISNLVARNTVLCAGAWTAKILASLNIALDVKPVKGQMLLFKTEKQLISSMVLSKGRYLIPRKDGHILVGSTLEHKNFDKTPTDEAKESLLGSAYGILPALKKHSLQGHWAGLRPGTDNLVPFIGAVPGYENLYVNAGQYRNGLVLAPASARLMIDVLLKQASIVDKSTYTPKTFPV